MHYNDTILDILFKNKDEKYKNFNSKIVKTKQNMIGVRLPMLRKIAKQIIKENNEVKFIKSDKNNIYEMVLLEGLVISYIDDSFINKVDILDSYISKVDNWACIDSIFLKIKNIDIDKKNNLNTIITFLKSSLEFKVRGGFVLLLVNYIQKDYLDIIFKLSCKYNNQDKYYIYMANAWLISFCMAKFPTQTIKFFKNNSLDKTTHNLAIQKSIDSFRVSIEDKLLLKQLKKYS